MEVLQGGFIVSVLDSGTRGMNSFLAGDILCCVPGQDPFTDSASLHPGV